AISIHSRGARVRRSAARAPGGRGADAPRVPLQRGPHVLAGAQPRAPVLPHPAWRTRGCGGRGAGAAERQRQLPRGRGDVPVRPSQHAHLRAAAGGAVQGRVRREAGGHQRHAPLLVPPLQLGGQVGASRRDGGGHPHPGQAALPLVAAPAPPAPGSRRGGRSHRGAPSAALPRGRLPRAVPPLRGGRGVRTKHARRVGQAFRGRRAQARLVPRAQRRLAVVHRAPPRHHRSAPARRQRPARLLRQAGPDADHPRPL
ncbi:MAG: CBM50, partial [uncultured Gemmatimonadetes bacterium]